MSVVGGEGKRYKQRLRTEQRNLHGATLPFQAVVSALNGSSVTLLDADGIPFEQPAAKIKGVLIESGDLVLVAPLGTDGEEFVVIGTVDDGAIPTELELPAQIRSVGTNPSMAILTAAGTTATGSIVGTDTAGIIQLTPGGTGIATGNIVTVTFSTPRASGNYAIALTPNSASSRTFTNIGPAGRTSASFSLTVGAALSSGSNYQWLYSIIGY